MTDYKPFEVLEYENRFVKVLSQQIQGADCFAPFVSLNPDENLVVLRLSAEKIKRLLSSILTGADICYPDESLQVYVDFLAGIHCPPVLEEQDCFEYPTYASFLTYEPINPYLQPDTIPDGYVTQPFIVNGENGNNVPGYEHYDVIVPTSAITLDIDWLTTIAGQLPTIKVMVNGAGKAFLKLLTIPLGGVAVITLDTPPNILDIITGVVLGAENIVDLNQDLVSLPPETAQELIYEMDITSPGMHTIYIVFLPILDDSFVPFRFGGGLRGVQLCDMVEEPEVGITNLRFENCNLEMMVNGVWGVVNGWENWLDCIPNSGGGGGVAGIIPSVYRVQSTANQQTSSATQVDVPNSQAEITHTFTYPNALIVVNNAVVRHSSASALTFLFLVVNGSGGSIPGATARAQGTENVQLQAADKFENILTGTPITVKLQWSTTAATATWEDMTSLLFQIIEYEDASNLFVEDVRILGGELQKKIGGVWLNVTESLAALLSSIQTIANNALSVANSAVAVNNTQNSQISAIVAVNNTQNTRLDNLEDDVLILNSHDAIIWPQVTVWNNTLADHEARIDALENAPNASWFHLFDFRGGDAQGWSGQPLLEYLSFGHGFQIESQGALTRSGFLLDQRVEFVQIFTRRYSGGIDGYRVWWGSSTTPAGTGSLSSGALLTMSWIQLGNVATYHPSPRLEFENFSGEFRIEQMLFTGRGTNPFS